MRLSCEIATVRSQAHVHFLAVGANVEIKAWIGGREGRNTLGIVYKAEQHIDHTNTTK